VCTSFILSTYPLTLNLCPPNHTAPTQPHSHQRTHRTPYPHQPNPTSTHPRLTRALSPSTAPFLCCAGVVSVSALQAAGRRGGKHAGRGCFTKVCNRSVVRGRTPGWSAHCMWHTSCVSLHAEAFVCLVSLCLTDADPYVVGLSEPAYRSWRQRCSASASLNYRVKMAL
jgi:hypothetical protein